MKRAFGVALVQTLSTWAEKPANDGTTGLANPLSLLLNGTGNIQVIIQSLSSPYSFFPGKY
jgi:hypothetical protein